MEVLLEPLTYNNTVLNSVMGGRTASLREFPFQVGISYDNSYYCGGSIIGSLFILTAAHCVYNLQPSKFKVTAGDHNRLVSEGTEQDRSVSKIFIHDGYNKANLDNDIAIMVLNEPLKLNKNVQTIKYFRDPATHSGMATVSGWGQLLNGAPSHPILQKADVPIVPTKQCRDSFLQNGIRVKIEDDTLCAGSHGKDACRGDSGGPLSARVNGTETLVGVVSYGVPCNVSWSLPGVYSNVSKYGRWIEESLLKYGRESGRCQPHEFYCATDNVCIFSHWVCDGDKDCSGGEDEILEICQLPCPKNQFRCDGGKCVNNDWRCDGRPDCSDAEDERGCDACKPGSTLCSSENRCFSNTSACDGNFDCKNGEDERNCSSCHGRGFHCKKDHKCIPYSWRCDGERDCQTDGADESKCVCLFGLCFNRLL